MTINLSVDDNLAAALESRAKKHRLSIEQFAIGVLTEALEQSETETPNEVVAKIQAMAPNPSGVRAATASLAEALSGSTGDTHFDLDGWTRRWSKVEGELKAITRANDIAEGRGG